MRLAIVLCVLGLAGAAHADASKRECSPRGGVLFEIAQRSDVKASTAWTRLYENGAWESEVFDVDRKVIRTRWGCLGPREMAAVRAEFRAAKWQTTRANVKCPAKQPRFIVYKWKMRLLYFERSCSEHVLDEQSRRALDLVGVYLQAPIALDDGGLPCDRNPLTKGCM